MSTVRASIVWVGSFLSSKLSYTSKYHEEEEILVSIHFISSSYVLKPKKRENANIFFEDEGLWDFSVCCSFEYQKWIFGASKALPWKIRKFLWHVLLLIEIFHCLTSGDSDAILNFAETLLRANSLVYANELRRKVKKFSTFRVSFWVISTIIHFPSTAPPTTDDETTRPNNFEQIVIKTLDFKPQAWPLLHSDELLASAFECQQRRPQRWRATCIKFIRELFSFLLKISPWKQMWTSLCSIDFRPAPPPLHDLKI